MAFKEISSGRVLCEPLTNIDDFHKYWTDYAWERVEIKKQNDEWIGLGNDYQMITTRLGMLLYVGIIVILAFSINLIMVKL